MNKTCTACSAVFEITDEDLSFYDRISPVFNGQKCKVPPPTHCPDCRLQRRLAHRNDRKLYERTEDDTGKKLISMYSSDAPVVVMHKDTWFGDSWDPRDYGREYDFSRSFFEQFYELLTTVPRAHLITVNTENAEYTNYNSGNKGCYLCFAGNYTEDSFYSYNAEMSKDCCDCHYVFKCELCYECVQCEQCYNTRYALHSSNCKDCWFVEDCAECSDCILCWNLHRKQYCILNEQFSKDEYEQRKSGLNLNTLDGIQSAVEKWKNERLQYPKRARHNRMAEDCSGEYLSGCNNCHYAFNVAKGCQDCKYVFTLFPELKDAYDCTFSGEQSQLMYECMASGEDCHAMLFGNINVCASSNLLYCDTMFGAEHCFGSTCLRKQKYCILNNQYTKEEYENLVPKIIEHMRSTGEWGEYFPIEKSLFAYNESHAQEYYPLSQADVLSRNWRWAEEKNDIAKVKQVIPAEQLPACIRDVSDDIVNWAVSCSETGRPFRIVKQELVFYRRLDLPLPTVHPDVRHQHRAEKRNKHHLYNSKCNKCSCDIETPYSPERPEKVYCEACYLGEVY